LKIKHPVTDEEQIWQADLPEDIQRFIESLRKYRKI
jgi:hypothetical protein